MVSATYNHVHKFELTINRRKYYHELEGPLKHFAKFWNVEPLIKSV